MIKMYARTHARTHEHTNARTDRWKRDTERKTEREREREKGRKDSGWRGRKRVGRKPDDVVNPSDSVCSPYPFRSRRVVLAQFLPFGLLVASFSLSLSLSLLPLRTPNLSCFVDKGTRNDLFALCTAASWGFFFVLSQFWYYQNLCAIPYHRQAGPYVLPYPCQPAGQPVYAFLNAGISSCAPPLPFFSFCFPDFCSRLEKGIDARLLTADGSRWDRFRKNKRRTWVDAIFPRDLDFDRESFVISARAFARYLKFGMGIESPESRTNCTLSLIGAAAAGAR